MQQTSPHAHKAGSTGSVMLQVIYATLPGLIALTWFFGPGSLINVILALGFCLGFEAAVLKLRKRPVKFFLTDYSAAVTAVLLGLALPPYCPWWLVAIGAASAIILAKQLYGGMGYNPFNPAMVAYVVLLISFPVEMTQWAAPANTLAEGASLVGIGDALQHIFTGSPIASAAGLDAWTGATPLDAFKQNQGLMVEQLYSQERIFNSASFAGAGWEWVNVAFLLGGVYLLARKVFTWHAPIAMLAAITVCAFLGNDGGSSESHGGVLLHLFSGATMLGAFFIATDPVSSAVSNRGRLIYGALIGVLVYVIRVWGNYPDAVAFAVLLMNFAAPFIDYYTVPRTYGHANSKRATAKKEP